MPSSLAETVLEVLYPMRCAGCDRPGELLCDACRAALPLIAPARACPRCGAPEGARWCGECPPEDFAFEAVRCAGVLEAPLSRMVRLHKDSDEWRLAPLLAGLVSDVTGDWGDRADCVVPVPARPSAVARRGYDHAAAIASLVAARFGLPAIDALVASERRDQRGLSATGRRANSAGAMRVCPKLALPPRVLLLDDVFTTGATLDSAARACREAGAGEVRALTVARTA